MAESFITAFIIYFVVIDPIGNMPVFLALTQAQSRRQKLKTAFEATIYATGILVFFALCGTWLLAYLNITENAFKIAGGIILLIVSLDMLSAKRQERKKNESEAEQADPDTDNLAIYPVAIPLLAGPSAITSVLVVHAGFSDGFQNLLIGYSALISVMVITGIVLCVVVYAEGWLNKKLTMVISRITAIILAGLSVQYILDGLTALRWQVV